MKVVEMIDETALGKYNDCIHNANIIMKRANDLGCFTPFDFDNAQNAIDKAVESLCAAMKDGSLQSGKSFLTREYDNNYIAA